MQIIKVWDQQVQQVQLFDVQNKSNPNFSLKEQIQPQLQSESLSFQFICFAYLLSKGVENIYNLLLTLYES